jgi:hypothetical protein
MERIGRLEEEVVKLSEWRDREIEVAKMGQFNLRLRRGWSIYTTSLIGRIKRGETEVL